MPCGHMLLASVRLSAGRLCAGVYLYPQQRNARHGARVTSEKVEENNKKPPKIRKISVFLPIFSKKRGKNGTA